jgi:hypothetical protein
MACSSRHCALHRAPVALVVWLILSACERGKELQAKATLSATPTATATSTPTPTPTPTAIAAPAPTRTSPPPDPPPSPSAGCRPLRGPLELPLRGPAALVLRGDTLNAILDDDGRPRVVSLAAGPLPASASPMREPATGGASAGLAVPCAIAGERIFCPDRTGAVHRVNAAGEDRVVASSRTGTRVAAGMLGGTHTGVAYLASRKTSEGWVSEAWLAVDDDVPLRLSEDGSGATSLAVAQRESSLLALTVDARSALTAMHARSVAYDRGLRLGEDVVVFVGGPGDRRTAAALALPITGPAWALLPIARDVGSFGLATVRLDEPPRVDEPVVWSMYPNGLDPAPVAAAARGGRTWVARVRPRAADPSSSLVLELGDLATDGGFVVRDVVATAGTPRDVALTHDSHGALWVAWVDTSGSWVERLACR